MKNALGDFISQAGPKPGQRQPGMGRPPFAATEDKPAKAAEPAQAAPYSTQPSSRINPVQPLAAKANPGARGPVQQDGLRSTPFSKPEGKSAPLKSSSDQSASPTGQRGKSSMENSMDAMADRMHPVKTKGRR